MTPKHISETKDALRHAASEIEMLRAQIAALTPRAQAFDTFSKMIELLAPTKSQGYGIDAVWILRKLLAEIEAEERAGTEKDGLNAEHDKALNLGNAVNA